MVIRRYLPIWLILSLFCYYYYLHDSFFFAQVLSIHCLPGFLFVHRFFSLLLLQPVWKALDHSVTLLCSFCQYRFILDKILSRLSKMNFGPNCPEWVWPPDSQIQFFPDYPRCNLAVALIDLYELVVIHTNLPLWSYQWLLSHRWFMAWWIILGYDAHQPKLQFHFLDFFGTTFFRFYSGIINLLVVYMISPDVFSCQCFEDLGCNFCIELNSAFQNSELVGFVQGKQFNFHWGFYMLLSTRITNLILVLLVLSFQKTLDSVLHYQML